MDNGMQPIENSFISRGSRAFARRSSRQYIAAAVAACTVALGGCVSLGAELPERLFTLTPQESAPIGEGASAMIGSAAGNAPAAIAVLTPEVPAKLDVLRVPVSTSPTTLAYLKDAVWVEKPARLFRRLIGETVRARLAAQAGPQADLPLVFDSDDNPVIATRTLRGSLGELGYNAATSEVVVRFDALRIDEDGRTLSRRFEARRTNILPEADAVGPAINDAANEVAGDIANWMVGEAPQ